MIGFNQLQLLLLASLSIDYVLNSEELKVKSMSDQENQSSHIHMLSPLKMYQYPSRNYVQAYLYFPSDDHYEIINIKRPVQSQKLTHLKNNNDNKIIVKKSDNDKVSSIKEGGKKYKDSHHRKHGHKSSEGYSKDLKYTREKKGSYNKHSDSDDENSKKKSQSDDFDEKEHDQADNKHEENEKGEKYNSKKNHQKGSKSKGYHNIFMKDEYKKDHIFYDNADDRGYYSKHGSEHTEYDNDEHTITKGSNSDSGKASDSKKRQSLKDKEKYDVADEKYKKESKKKLKDTEGENYYLKNGKSTYNVAIKHIMER